LTTSHEKGPRPGYDVQHCFYCGKETLDYKFEVVEVKYPKIPDSDYCDIRIICDACTAKKKALQN
jgi:hypothetical protein